jgi:hypothetical protein
MLAPQTAPASDTLLVIEVSTRHGPARVHLHPAEKSLGLLALGHGAGGGVGSADLVAVTEAAGGVGFGVALVEQPYRVAGRRSPAPAAELDRAWTDVIEYLRATGGHRLPVVVGGRSSGARVACRTAAATGAVAVLCLAFPLQPPRRPGKSPAPSRLPELEQVSVPTLVVQGARDPFGVPSDGEKRRVLVVQGDHSLRKDLPAVTAAVGAWLSGIVAGRAQD